MIKLFKLNCGTDRSLYQMSSPRPFFCSLFSGPYRPDFFMPRFYPQNFKHLQQYHRPDRVNPRGDRIEIIFNKNGIEHLPFWSLCNKGNSDNADRSFFRKSASLPHHSDLATLLSTKAISQAQHEKSLNCLIEKMGIKEGDQ